MQSTFTRAAAFVVLSAPLFLAGCADVVSPATPQAPLLLNSAVRANSSVRADDVRALAVCPTPRTSRVSRVIGPRGGSLSLRGHRLTIGPGILTKAVRFTITEPAGRYLRVDFKAAGIEHYQFDSPVEVTISYARCPRQHRMERNPTVWYLPASRREQGGEIPAVLNERRRSVRFLWTHLSTYAVAW